ESTRPGRNEPAFFAMKPAGEEPSPRPAVRDGMKQETLRVPVVEPRIKESGVGRDYGRTGRCSNPSASASLASRRRIFAPSSAQRLSSAGMLRQVLLAKS